MSDNTSTNVFLTTTNDARPNCGPLQLDNDFPGMFRRGDRCFGFVTNTMRILDELMERIKHATTNDPIDIKCATHLLDEIEFHLQAIIGKAANYKLEERQAYRALLDYLGKPKRDCFAPVE